MPTNVLGCAATSPTSSLASHRSDRRDPQTLNVLRCMNEVAPLVLDEIILRLLRSPLGPRVALIGQADSRLQRVAQAVAWVQAHYDQPLDVERLATLAHMSPSTFHQHFKAITSMSPLQYQKALRLQEARRLMLMTMLDAGAASRRVGYLGPSQFSREYGRYFGSAPTRDMARLRQQRESPLEARAESSPPLLNPPGC